MRYVRLQVLFLAFAALLASTLAHAQEGQRHVAWAHESADIAPDPAAVWGRLDNGMRYVVLPNDTPKGRISLRLLVDAGSFMERDDQRGLAHFLEHMAFKGSENMRAGDLVQYLERLGMAFGADTNARTGFDSTVYQLELPSNDPALLDRSLFVLREKAGRLLIPGAELERERGVILSEKRLRDTAQFRAMDANLRFLFPDSLISARMPIGREEVIASAPRERLVDFYDTWYRPSRMTLVAVGAVDPALIARAIHQHFADFQARSAERSDPRIGDIGPRQLETRLHYEAEGRTNVTLQVARPARPGPDTHARRYEDIQLYLAHAVLNRRLATLAMAQDAPFVGGFAQSDDFLEFARVANVTINTEPARWKDGLRVAEQELRRALKHGFASEELDEQTRILVTQFEESTRAAGTRESADLANEIVQSVSEGLVFTHPRTDLAELRGILAETTPASVLAAMRAMWSDAGPLVFVSGPVKLDAPQAAIREAYLDSAAVPVDAPAQARLAPFGYENSGSAQPAQRRVSDALQVTQLRFANNVRVNLKPTRFEANSILISARIGGGRLELPMDKPGLEALAEGAFVSGGLGKHSLDELNRIIAGRSVGLGFEVEDDAFVLGGRTTPADLLLQLQLLAAYVTDPGYRSEALAKFRQTLPQRYQMLERTPTGVLQKEVVRFLRGGDARFGFPDQATLATRSFENLRAVLDPALAGGYLELTLVGDFEMESAIAAVSATFGALPLRAAAKPPFTAERDVRFPAGSPEVVRFDYETNDPKAIAATYWPTTDLSRLSDARRLFVLGKVLGNRVLERARNLRGLTYTAHGDHAPSQAFPGYGVLFGVVDAPPQKAEDLARLIRDIGSEIRRDGITQDELERARNPIVAELKKLLETNVYLLSGVVSGSQERPERLQRALTSVEELSSLSVEDIDAVARQYLDPARALPVAIVPGAITAAPTAADPIAADPTAADPTAGDPAQPAAR
ncbi:MAG: insulinase family protein [Burkholderiales bacterium]|nr:insulinase family protein [Burkholderiales bacterium]